MKDGTKRKWWLAYSIILIIILIGITYAWFVQNSSMTTLLSIEKPDTITISDIDGTDMTELDLDYREGIDKKYSDGTIHIYRPLCIKSTSESHQLEIVHTTNLVSLNFKIYPIKKEDKFDKENPGTPLLGSYVNSLQDPEKTAEPDVLQNYSSSDSIDPHAYPLYWLAQICSKQSKSDDWRVVFPTEQEEFDVATKKEKTFYYTYYYLEISWKEDTKETDLFYIMARNIAE